MVNKVLHFTASNYYFDHYSKCRSTVSDSQYSKCFPTSPFRLGLSTEMFVFLCNLENQ